MSKKAEQRQAKMKARALLAAAEAKANLEKIGTPVKNEKDFQTGFLLGFAQGGIFAVDELLTEEKETT